MTLAAHFPYPRLLLVATTVALSVVFFYERDMVPFQPLLHEYAYLTAFVAGFLWVYGFTAAPATAVLLALGQETNIVMLGIVGSVGAWLGDLLIFRFVQHSLMEELGRIARWRIWLHLPRWHERLPDIVREYLFLFVAGFLIVSPVPDEIGVTLIASSARISSRMFSIMAYALDLVGIMLVLYIGRELA